MFKGMLVIKGSLRDMRKKENVHFASLIVLGKKTAEPGTTPLGSSSGLLRCTEVKTLSHSRAWVWPRTQVLTFSPALFSALSVCAVYSTPLALITW